MNAITAKEAKRNFNHIIQKVISDSEPTIICSENGDNVVLLSLDEFNSWRETLYLLSNPANAEHLRKSISEARMGKTSERKLLDS